MVQNGSRNQRTQRYYMLRGLRSRSYAVKIFNVVVTCVFVILCGNFYVTEAFCGTPCHTRLSSINLRQLQSSSRHAHSILTRRMVSDGNDDDNDDNERIKMPTSKSEWTKSDIITRFTSPIIDDPGLPLSDVLIAQVIAPSLQVVWISIQHAPQPTWLRPIFDTSVLYTNRGSLLAPALIHGAALASCWIAGALAAKAYERKSISPVPMKSRQQQQLQLPKQEFPSKVDWDYSDVLLAIFKSGAFAVGLLVFATQIDLLLEYKRYVQVGESDDIDFRLLVALVEVINDVVFEVITITTWRLFLAYQTERMAREE